MERSFVWCVRGTLTGPTPSFDASFDRVLKGTLSRLELLGYTLSDWPNDDLAFTLRIDGYPFDNVLQSADTGHSNDLLLPTSEISVWFPHPLVLSDHDVSGLRALRLSVLSEAGGSIRQAAPNGNLDVLGTYANPACFWFRVTYSEEKQVAIGRRS